MTTFVQITDTEWVNPEHVAAIRINEAWHRLDVVCELVNGREILVRRFEGSSHQGQWNSADYDRAIACRRWLAHALVSPEEWVPWEEAAPHHGVEA